MVCGGPLAIYGVVVYEEEYCYGEVVELNLVAGMEIKDVSISCIFAVLETHNSNSNVSLF